SSFLRAVYGDLRTRPAARPGRHLRSSLAPISHAQPQLLVLQGPIRNVFGERAMTTGIGIDKASELTPKDFERLLLRSLTSVPKGDFSVRMPVEFTGTAGKIADTLDRKSVV